MIFIIFIVLVIGVILAILAGNEEAKEVEAKRKKQEESYIDKYGSITRIVEDCSPDMKPQYSYVFENSKIIIINGVEYKFADILDFSVNGGESYKITTSTSSALGRGIIGGVLFGGIGALAGAGTASKKAKSSKTDILISITTKSLSNPIIEYRSGRENKAQELISLLKIIIDRESKVDSQEFVGID